MFPNPPDLPPNIQTTDVQNSQQFDSIDHPNSSQMFWDYNQNSHQDIIDDEELWGTIYSNFSEETIKTAIDRILEAGFGITILKCNKTSKKAIQSFEPPSKEMPYGSTPSKECDFMYEKILSADDFYNVCTLFQLFERDDAPKILSVEKGKLDELISIKVVKTDEEAKIITETLENKNCKVGFMLLALDKNYTHYKQLIKIIMRTPYMVDELRNRFIYYIFLD